jgi:gluconate:H+ symporter, GntP family
MTAYASTWLGLGLSIGWIVFSTVRLKWHPFLALLLASFVGGWLMGLPPDKLPGIISQGFGQMMTHIGLVVILGTLFGTLLEKTGATHTLAHAIVRLAGNRHPQWAMAMLGFLVGIPIFCDSGYVILSGLLPPVAQRTGASMGGLVAGLAGGLYITHTLLPPHPGALAGAGQLGLSLGPVMLVGLGVSLFPLAILWLYATRVNKGSTVESLLLANHQPQHLPPLWRALVPLCLPLLLLTAGALAGVFKAQCPPDWFNGLTLLGQPLVALSLGLVACIGLMQPVQTNWLNEGFRHAGPILILVGAGGMFGAVIKASPVSQLNGLLLADIPVWVMLIVAFGVAALLKTAQGSTTAALIVTSSLLAPLAQGWETLPRALLLSAIGSGAMLVSHANDAYFWIIQEFSQMDTAQTYRVWTRLSAWLGLASLTGVLVCHGVLTLLRMI